jgi:hypothetical protein
LPRVARNRAHYDEPIEVTTGDRSGSTLWQQCAGRSVDSSGSADSRWRVVLPMQMHGCQRSRNGQCDRIDDERGAA